jgi:hypothetical protein
MRKAAGHHNIASPQIITFAAIPAIDVSTSVGKLAAFSKLR